MPPKPQEVREPICVLMGASVSCRTITGCVEVAPRSVKGPGDELSGRWGRSARTSPGTELARVGTSLRQEEGGSDLPEPLTWAGPSHTGPRAGQSSRRSGARRASPSCSRKAPSRYSMKPSRSSGERHAKSASRSGHRRSDCGVEKLGLPVDAELDLSPASAQSQRRRRDRHASVGDVSADGVERRAHCNADAGDNASRDDARSRSRRADATFCSSWEKSAT